MATFSLHGFLDPSRDHWGYGYEIGHIARAIATGQGFADPYWTHTGPTALLTPVYPVLMAAVFSIFGVYTVLSAAVFLAINSFFSAVTSIPIYFLGRRCFDEQTAIVAAWTWAFFPNSVYFSATTMWYHGFVALLLTVILLLTMQLDSGKSRSSRWMLLGFLTGFAALTNPVVLTVAPGLALWLWRSDSGSKKQSQLGISVVFMTMAITIAPWFLRNLRTFHKPIPLKDGLWAEICVGNVSNSLHWWDGKEHPSGSDIERTRFEQLGESRYMDHKRVEAISYVEHHPGQYLLRSGRRVVFLWTGFWSVNQEYLQEEPLDLPNIFFLTTLSCLALAGLYKALCNPPTRRTAPADAAVRRYFEDKNLTGSELELAVRKFSAEALQDAQIALQHAYALDRLGESLSPGEMSSLSAASRQQWAEMANDHANDLSRRLIDLKGLLTSILPAGSPDPDTNRQVSTIETLDAFKEWAHQLLENTQRLNRDTGNLFSSTAIGVPPTSNDMIVKALRTIPLEQAQELESFADRLSSSGNSKLQQ